MFMEGESKCYNSGKIHAWVPLQAQANGDIGSLKRKAQSCTLLRNEYKKGVKRRTFNNKGNPVSGGKNTGLELRRYVTQPGLTSKGPWP